MIRCCHCVSCGVWLTFLQLYLYLHSLSLPWLFPGGGKQKYSAVFNEGNNIIFKNCHRMEACHLTVCWFLGLWLVKASATSPDAVCRSYTIPGQLVLPQKATFCAMKTNKKPACTAIISNVHDFAQILNTGFWQPNLFKKEDDLRPKWEDLTPKWRGPNPKMKMI